LKHLFFPEKVHLFFISLLFSSVGLAFQTLTAVIFALLLSQQFMGLQQVSGWKEKKKDSILLSHKSSKDSSEYRHLTLSLPL